MITLQQVKGWNFLQECLSTIQDQNLRIAMAEEFRRRALKLWGWVPGEKHSESKPDLNEEQQQFMNDIHDSIEFGIDVREPLRKKIMEELEHDMWDFVREGNTLMDIPPELRTPVIVAAYMAAERKYAEDIFAGADAVIPNTE